MGTRRSAPESSVLGSGGPKKMEHVSYSTFYSWFECPKKVQLAKIQKAPAVPAWWFAGGSAVHAATEEYDLWTLMDPLTRPTFKLVDEFERAFDAEVMDIESRHPDRTTWRAAGKKDDPETYAKWMKLGPVLVGNYIRWRMASPDYVLWETPDGKPAVELEVSWPGFVSPEPYRLPVKAYLDRVFKDTSNGDLVIVDIKTGTRKPDSPLQFGTYNAGLKLTYDVSARWGMAFMNRDGKLSTPFDMATYTPEYVSKQYSRMSMAVRYDIFPPHVHGGCFRCDVATSCYAYGGDLSNLYDPDDPRYDGPPF